MKSKRDASGPTCFTASRFTPSPCRRCENIGRISNCWCGTFCEEINSRVGKNIEKIPQSVMQSLTGMDYPGNVRELKNLIEHAVITSDNGILRLPETSNPASLPETNASNAFSPISLDDAQRQHITHVLDHTDGRIEGPGGAAEILGLKPSTLRHRIKKLGIQRNN
jgi:transcriptional regulator with GAF, ATPase, and Fis domain